MTDLVVTLIAVFYLCVLIWGLPLAYRMGRSKGHADQHLIEMDCTCGLSVTASMHKRYDVERAIEYFTNHTHLEVQ